VSQSAGLRCVICRDALELDGLRCTACEAHFHGTCFAKLRHCVECQSGKEPVALRVGGQPPAGGPQPFVIVAGLLGLAMLGVAGMRLLHPPQRRQEPTQLTWVIPPRPVLPAVAVPKEPPPLLEPGQAEPAALPWLTRVSADLIQPNAKHLVYSPDGRYLAATRWDWPYTSIFDTRTRKEVQRLERGKAVAFSPQGHRAAVADENGSVQLVDLQTGRRGPVLATEQPVEELAFSPDGRYLVGVTSSEIRLWHTATGLLFRKLKPSGAGVDSVAISPDGRQIALGGCGKQVLLLEVSGGRQVLDIPGNIQGEVICDRLNFSPDGRYLSSRDDDRREFVIRDLQASGAVKLRLPSACALRFFHSGHKVAYLEAASCETWHLVVQNLDTGDVKRYALQESNPRDLALDPSDRYVSIAAGNWPHIATYDLSRPVNGPPPANLPGPIQTLTYSRDGTLIHGTVQGGMLQTWDARSRTPFPAIKASPADHHTYNTSVACSLADGSLLWATGNRITRIRNPRRPGEHREVGLPDVAPFPLAVSANGNALVATTSDLARLCLVQPTTGDLKCDLGRYDNFCSHTAFSPDGNWFAAPVDGKLAVWKAPSGVRWANHPCDEMQIYAVAFSPDGQTTACVGNRPRVYLHDVSGKHSAQVHLIETSRESGTGNAVAFSPDGKHLAVGFEGTIHLWPDYRVNRQIQITGHVGAVRALAFSPDGSMLASGGDDSMLHIHQLRSISESGTR
jgi:WD40 repeat protein